MKEEIVEIFTGVGNYILKVVDYVNPFLAFISSAFMYILFPDDAYIPLGIGLSIAVIFDVATKYYSIGVKHGGFWKAFKNKHITSEAMWKGTKKKIISILSVMILCGLLIRFTSAVPQIAIGFSTVVYGFMFFREAQSIIENLIDAGHDDLKWFLAALKRKKKEMIDIDEDELNEKEK